MATKPQIGSDGFSSIAGMSKTQLYELMSQMKLLIEQNQQQARQILVDNPMLTKALFQAQIMLGMVKPTQPDNIQKVLSQQQQQQQPTHVGQQSNVQTTLSLPVQPSHQSQTSSSQPIASSRQQLPPPPSIPLPSSSVPSLNFQSQTAPSIPQHSAQQVAVPANAQASALLAPQSSQIHSLPLPPPLAPSHYPMLQHHMPIMSSQAQPSLQLPGAFNQSLQPPLPQQPRPPSMQHFPHQLHSQMPHNLGYQPSSAPQQHLSQSVFHPGINHGSSFPQGQPPLPSQPPPQHLYQGGSHMGSEYSSQLTQIGSSMHPDRGHWGPGLLDRGPGGPHLAGPHQPAPVQMLPGLGGGGQQPLPPGPPPITREMESALLQQVMSLTPEQINLLPPEQREQVKQLQAMLR